MSVCVQFTFRGLKVVGKKRVMVVLRQDFRCRSSRAMVLLLRLLLLLVLVLLLVARCKVLLLVEHGGAVVSHGIERLLLALLRQHREGLGNGASRHSH